MLQFSHLLNGDLQVSTSNADQLVKELFVQFGQKMAYVPHSFVAKSYQNTVTRLVVSQRNDIPKLVDLAVEVYEISPITRKIISRNSEHFFAGLKEQFDQGYAYSEGSASLSPGSCSAVVTKAASAPAPTPVADNVPEFDLEVALALQTKQEVIAYCETFGIKVDSRKSLPKIQNWLKTKPFEGK